MNYKKILLSLEQLSRDVEVLKTAIDCAYKYSAELTILHINTNMAGVPSRAMRPLEHKVTLEELKDAAKEHNLNNIKINFEIVQDDDVLGVIVEKAKKFDLLVLGHRHMNFFEEMLVDSIDEKIINRVQCHCLIVNKG